MHILARTYIDTCMHTYIQTLNLDKIDYEYVQSRSTSKQNLEWYRMQDPKQYLASGRTQLLDIFQIAQTPIFFAPVFTICLKLLKPSDKWTLFKTTCLLHYLCWTSPGNPGDGKNHILLCVVATSWRIPKQSKTHQSWSKPTSSLYMCVCASSCVLLSKDITTFQVSLQAMLKLKTAFNAR